MCVGCVRQENKNPESSIAGAENRRENSLQFCRRLPGTGKRGGRHHPRRRHGDSGPFDYEHGISRMQGLNKYDAIYGIPLEMEIKVRVPKLKEAKFLFLHDIEAFALGESWYGTCCEAEKILCVCIGTGAGSAFVEHRKPVKTGNGVPENGWIYQIPFRQGILDDYLSVRGRPFWKMIEKKRTEEFMNIQKNTEIMNYIRK